MYTVTIIKGKKCQRDMGLGQLPCPWATQGSGWYRPLPLPLNLTIWENFVNKSTLHKF